MKNKTKKTIWLKLFNTQNENQRRWLAAEKAIDVGFGGITEVRALTGMSRTTITKGIKELTKYKLNAEKIRRKGGGRKNIKETQNRIIQELEAILEENTAGDPMSVLKWTCKTTRTISDELKRKGYVISHETVSKLLKELEYSLQANKKVISNYEHPDRDSQFLYINEKVKEYINKGNPVISVDTKKKELVGNFKNNGQNWHKKGNAPKVSDHDFLSQSEGVAIPYGAYDVLKNEGFVNVGISHDTSEFAVNSIRMWWEMVGKKNYSKSKQILICADGGGSNGSRNRAWKTNLQKFANDTGIKISVCHYPPGTSKWNKIEHRMFSFISMNWKGKPLENYATIINLIGGTKTKTGLKIKAKLDETKYEKGIKISDEEFKNVNIKPHKINPKWNYTIGRKLI